MFLLGIILIIPGLSQLFRKYHSVKDERLERDIFGLRFSNPVGLAAGFDKDGKYFNKISALGFGFLEIGTITPKAQDGNEKPRLFRLPADEGLINRMGFNNEGVEKMVERLKKRSNNKIIIGGNIGKNKVTPNEKAEDDYLICFESLFPWVDYFALNVSSPNTPGLRELQEKEPLSKLINKIQKCNQSKDQPKPILLKIAPDLTFEQLDNIIEIVRNCGLSGIIATNTTIDRKGLQTSKDKIEKIGAGGLSGKPLKNRSTEIIQYISDKTNGKIPIIGVGGIGEVDDAIEKLKAGARLIQVYSGLIYQGPAFIKRINKEILKQKIY